MGAARIIFSPTRLRCGAFGAAAGFALHGYVYNSQRTFYDSSAPAPAPAPVPAQWPRDLVGKQANNHPSSTKRDGEDLATGRDEPDSHAPAFEHDDESAWANFSRDVDSFRQSLAGVDWGSFGDTITNFILPSWARQIPDQVRKLQFELSMEPGTLADEIWQDAADADMNPEVMWDASVRVSNDLCEDELKFRRKRKERLVPALARYLDIDERKIDPEDVPTIALCGSGGGLRALVAGTGSLLSAQEDGLFDCATYTAGVSGSCWLQTLYHTSLGKQDFRKLSAHLKNRIGVHIAFPPAALKLVSTAPTNKFLLSGFIEKLKGDPGADFGLVDIYGLLLGARLMVPKGELGVSDRDLKLSNQRVHLDEGVHPMPIYTAVRHEIPVDEVDIEAAADDESRKQVLREKARKEAWFQWFEFTPYEAFCEEFTAGIPTWALGRPFKNGHNVLLNSGFGLPEIRVPLLLGIWGSAFCATLSHYFKEIKPALTGLAGFDGLDNLLEQNNDGLVKIHPIDPATIPNFVYGMKDELPSSCPESIFKTDHFQLMDAGMSNNLPIYPLLRPGREVDILVAFDASADVKKENWLSIVDGYARQRGINGWPLGAGWPKASAQPTEATQALGDAQPTTTEEAAAKMAEAREEQRQTSGANSEAVVQDTPTESPSASSSSPSPPPSDLGYCTVWVGSKTERITTTEPPPLKSRRLDSSTPASETSFELMKPSAGLTLVYFPFLPNPAKVPDVDPDTSDFMSTWNFIYTPEQIEQVIALARANFDEGREQTRRCVRAVYERKRSLRLEREKERGSDRSREKTIKRGLRESADHFA
jgi:cytosolic phospholipase A2